MTSHRKPAFVIGAIVACVSSALLVSGFRPKRAEPRLAREAEARPSDPGETRELAEARADERQEVTPVPAARSGFYAAPSGTRLRFAVRSHQDSSLTLMQEQGRPATLSMDVQAELVLRVLARRGNEILASVEYESPRVAIVVAGATSDEGALEAQRELAVPVQVRLRDDGTVLGWRFPAGLSPATCMLQRTLFALARFVVPGDAGEQWTTSELDPSGTYEVAYRRGDDEARRTEILRRRQTCAPSNAGTGLSTTATVTDDSRAIFEHGLGWLVRAHCAESVRLGGPEDQFTAEVESLVTLDLMESEREAAPAEDGLWDLAWSDAAGIADRERDATLQEESRAETEIAGLSLENVLYDIERIIRTSGLDSRELFDSRERLKEFLRQRPAQLERFEELVSDGSLGFDALGVALSALGSVASPAGTEFLAMFLAEPTRSDEERGLAMLALFQVPAPDAEVAGKVAAQWLDTEADPQLRSTALLLFGAQAATSAERCGRLLAQKDLAAKDGLFDTYLAALGNAHLYDELELYMQDDDPAVRRTAEQVLSWR